MDTFENLSFTCKQVFRGRAWNFHLFSQLLSPQNNPQASAIILG